MSNAAVPYSLQLCSRTSLNLKAKFLEMEFDLAVTAPTGIRVLDMLRDVLGDKLRQAKVKDWKDMIANLLSRLYVTRNYAYNGEDTKSNIAKT
jgi:hypothetical protein